MIKTRKSTHLNDFCFLLHPFGIEMSESLAEDFEFAVCLSEMKMKRKEVFYFHFVTFSRFLDELFSTEQKQFLEQNQSSNDPVLVVVKILVSAK